MKPVLALVLVALAVATAKPAAPKPATSYPTQYDNVDIDQILNNDRLYSNYFNCLNNNGKCSPDGKTLKELLPDALATECKKCTEKQKVGTEKVIRFIIEKKPRDYEALEKLYDPTGIYKRKYQAEAKKHGIKLN